MLSEREPDIVFLSKGAGGKSFTSSLLQNPHLPRAVAHSHVALSSHGSKVQSADLLITNQLPRRAGRYQEAPGSTKSLKMEQFEAEFDGLGVA